MNLVSCPGFCTPSEAFNALHAGAHAIKLFPADATPPKVLKAMKAVFPGDARVIVVGGVDGQETMKPYWDVKASGFGIGSSLFKPGMTAAEVEAKAQRLVADVKALRGDGPDF